MQLKLPIIGLALCAALSSLAFAAPLKLEDWTDTQGNKFRGEAYEELGPIAIFRTGKATGRRVLFPMLSPEDCVRFYRTARTKPARAADWADAKSDISVELIGKVSRLQDGRIVPFDVKGKPEPLLYLVFYASSGEGSSWEMMGSSSAAFQTIQQTHPGKLEAVYMGMRHNQREHLNMVTGMHLPYLVANYHDQPLMHNLKGYGPDEGFGVVVFTRHGVPIFGALNPSKEDTAKLVAEVAGLLDFVRSDNPKTWSSVGYYYSAVQPAIHANDSAGPLLVGDPLKPEGLRQRKVERVEAKLSIDETGAVTAVEMVPHPSLPEKLVGPIGEALKKAMFVPAVDQGKFVAGTYTYVLDVK